ncbi:MAG: hypothetical protein ABSD98_02265 [Candidatus Korobacteraceae bacterium]|jgi:hypothetical protein
MANQIPTRQEIRERKQREKIASELEEYGLNHLHFDLKGARLTHKFFTTEFFDFGTLLGDNARGVARSWPGEPERTFIAFMQGTDTRLEFSRWCKSLKDYFDESRRTPPYARSLW